MTFANGVGPSHEAYARAALDRECEMAAATGSGRNTQLNRSAFSIGQLVGAGIIDRGEAEHRLMGAAEASGYIGKDGRLAAQATIRSGLDQGQRQPRTVPDQQYSNGHGHVGSNGSAQQAPRPAPSLDDLPLPPWTEPNADGKPQLRAIGKDEPGRLPKEIRRHLYRRAGLVVRVKIKQDGDPAWIDIYRVVDPDGQVGWQAKKPASFVPVPYGNAFDPDLVGETIIWAEGERDCDSLIRLGAASFTFGSASDIPPGAEELLKGRDVVVVGDRDDAGRRFVQRATDRLKATAKQVRGLVFDELSDGGDVTDWIAAGGTAEQLWARTDTLKAEAPAADDPRPEPKQDGAPVGPRIKAMPFVWRDPKTFPRRQWVYGFHLVRKFISCTVAPGGVGKTSLVLVEAVAMATGRPLLGIANRDGKLKVWVINLEDPLEEIERRVTAICLHFNIDPTELDGQLFLNSGRETEVIFATTTRAGTVVAQPVVDAMTAEIRAMQVDVVIIDPLVKAHRVPENDNGAIDMVCTAIAGIADVTNCAFDLIHHVRKTNGAEVTVEDGRGAVALLSASRSARALNRMTQDEADKAGIADPKGYFRAETGKANLAPVDKANWFKLCDVPLGNGDPDLPFDNSDRVAVAEAWTWPDALESVTTTDLRAVQQAVAHGRWRENNQSPDWVGRPIAGVLKLNPENRSDRAKITSLVRTWLSTGMLVKVEGQDEKRKQRTYIEVGKWATD